MSNTTAVLVDSEKISSTIKSKKVKTNTITEWLREQVLAGKEINTNQWNEVFLDFQYLFCENMLTSNAANKNKLIYHMDRLAEEGLVEKHVSRLNLNDDSRYGMKQYISWTLVKN